jgi:multicomponent Na+:H+ antiporter subunit A
MQPALGARLVAVALPFLAAPLVYPAHRLLGDRVAYLCAVVALAAFALVLSQAPASGTVAVEWVPTLGVGLELYVDGLATLVAGLASGVGVLIFTYSGACTASPDSPATTLSCWCSWGRCSAWSTPPT